MSVSEETARCASMEAAKRLEVERFSLPNKPTGTPEQLEEPVRCGDWGRAPALPLAPNPKGGQPLSLLRQTAPLTSSHRNAPLGRSGVAVGLFVEKSTLYSFLQNARPSVASRSTKGAKGDGARLLLPLCTRRTSEASLEFERLAQPRRRGCSFTQNTAYRRKQPLSLHGRQLPLHRGAKETVPFASPV